MLTQLSPHKSRDDVSAWAKARGADPKVVSRVMSEELVFTGIGLVDRIGMQIGRNLFPLLTVVPSRQRGASRKMATDCLWMEYVVRNNLPLELEAMAEANAAVEEAVKSKAGQQWIEVKMVELEALRDEVLGTPHPSKGG